MIKNLIKSLFQKKNKSIPVDDNSYEFCTNCDANLTLQKGYSNDLPYWICKGCGQMLINPSMDCESDIIWRCDNCGALLNTQEGFTEEEGEWGCLECGFKNMVSDSEVYLSEDEYLNEKSNPYKGLSDEEVLELSVYGDELSIGDKDSVFLVTNRETGKHYIKKYLTVYDKSIYEYLKDNPIEHMPRIVGLYEGSNGLIVIEEYIEGETIAERLDKATMPQDEAVFVIRSLCKILYAIHNLPSPIVHRDIKPSNVIIAPDNEVYLLDMNVAKWYDPDKADDTAYWGTQYYAAPEQLGYGFKASSVKADIYGVGVLLNVMITGSIPKEKRAEGKIWNIIEKCISLNAADRYTAGELIDELEKL